MHQAQVVRKVDNSLNHCSVDSMVGFVLSTLIHWIAIYPLDSVIQPWNNWGQVNHYPAGKHGLF